ncbi:hypothetical protein [Micromonospora okii]|uniref:hypothetical protein n=1 Tax=Micromonospora okii TaxID=1182970 RepID=UPI001E4FD35D|nr:hypothetical protein [Micromonospora okii]
MRDIARRALSAGAVAGLLAATAGIGASPAAASARPPASPCAVAPLPQPADMYRTDAYAVDPTGRFVVGGALRNTDEGGESFLLIWDRGRLRTIANPFGEGGTDVNSRGVVIGNGQTDGRSRPWVYRNGTFAFLPLRPATAKFTFVSAINRAGDIVGYRYDDVTNVTTALRWPAARPGTVETLSGAPTGAMAIGITRNGSIVGNAGQEPDSNVWVRRPGGRYAELTAPGADRSTVRAAEGRWAVGEVLTTDGEQFPVRWNIRTGTFTRTAPAAQILFGVNSRGVAIGADHVVRGSTARQLPMPQGSRTAGARAIADDGTIVGFSNEAGRVSAVRWTGC